MPLIEVDGRYVILPPIEALGRPPWAYSQLRDGWLVLRSLLFGNRSHMIKQLEELGDNCIQAEEIYQLVYDCQIPAAIAQEIVNASKHRMASELICWYLRWEQCVFDAYLQRQRLESMSPTWFAEFETVGTS